MLSLAGLAAASAVPVPASEICLANGQYFLPGELACLKRGDGEVLARCGRVLNNTSWKVVAPECPDEPPQGHQKSVPALTPDEGGTEEPNSG